MNEFIIIGNDKWLVQNKIDEIISKIKKSQEKNTDLSIQTINLMENIDQEWYQKLYNRSLWNNEIIVIVNNCQLIKKWSKKRIEKFQQALKNNPYHKFLIYYTNKKNELELLNLKWKQFYISNFTDLKKNRYINNFFEKNKIEIINPNILEKIADWLPNDMEIVDNNLLKIHSWFTKTKKPLKPEDLEQILDYYQTGNVFNFIEKIIQKKSQHLIWKQHEKIPKLELNIMFILKLLNLYATDLIHAKILIKNNTVQQIAQKLNKKPFFISNLINKGLFVKNDWLLKILNTTHQWQLKSRSLNCNKNDMINFFLLDLYEHN